MNRPDKNALISTIHFVIIIFLLILLIFIYYKWPWRFWQIDIYLWRWLPSSFYSIALWEAQNKVFGILFLIPIVYSILFLKWQNTVNFLLIFIVALSPIVLGFWNGVSHYMLYTYLFLLPVAIIIIINLQLELRRRTNQFIKQQESERRVYLSNVLRAQDSERKRVAQDIHDDAIQTLLAVANYAEVVKSAENQPEEQQDIINLIRTNTLQTVENLRRLTLNLNPRLLDELGLVPALNWLVNTMNSEGSIRYELLIDGDQPKLPPATEVSLFRIIQEALNNVKKHSKASNATVNIEFFTENLTITVQDNGQGFSFSSVRPRLITDGKMGVIGMAERVKFLGGTFHIDSGPGGGTTIFIQIPY
ncbi:MAG: sensor histidine kinase [Dehalococcoidales bacterium]|nr:sensor histidine kinase [Dehalococcoidales bacterium]